MGGKKPPTTCSERSARLFNLAHIHIVMIASDLRHPITITLDVATGQGQRGQDVYETTTVASCYAKIEPLSGRRLEIARQILPTSSHEVTIRYVSGVTPNCKIVFGSRTFNIGNVSDKYENNFQITMLCIEV